MSTIEERRNPSQNQWPFLRTNSVDEWVAAGQRFFHSVDEILVQQRELTPETLRGIGEYARFEHSPEIHPLVYIKPNVLECVQGAPVILIAFMAPSAGGKDSILKLGLPKISEFTTKIITHTTREPRNDGSDSGQYHFSRADEFQQWVDAGKFAEYLPPGEQGKHFYGTMGSDIEDAIGEGKRITVWRGEFIGWKELKYWMKRNHPEIPCFSVFTLPKAPLTKLMEWIQGKRGNDPSEQWRQSKARMEVIAGGSADMFIVNPIEESGMPTQATEAFIQLLTHINEG